MLPVPFDSTGSTGEFIVFFRLKGTDLLLPVRNDGQGGSLYASAGELGVIFAGQGACSVDPDQPVCFGAALGGVIQVVVLASVLQV